MAWWNRTSKPDDEPVSFQDIYEGKVAMNHLGKIVPIENPKEPEVVPVEPPKDPMNPIWRVPVLLPVLLPSRGLQQTELALSSVHFYNQPVIVFQLRHGGNYLPVPEWENHQYRYLCMSCFISCGDERNCFVTGLSGAKHLKEGPTIQQQDQMADHARQHAIMYSWAKGLK